MRTIQVKINWDMTPEEMQVEFQCGPYAEFSPDTVSAIVNKACVSEFFADPANLRWPTRVEFSREDFAKMNAWMMPPKNEICLWDYVKDNNIIRCSGHDVEFAVIV